MPVMMRMMSCSFFLEDKVGLHGGAAEKGEHEVVGHAGRGGYGVAVELGRRAYAAHACGVAPELVGQGVARGGLSGHVERVARGGARRFLRGDGVPGGSRGYGGDADTQLAGQGQGIVGGVGSGRGVEGVGAKQAGTFKHHDGGLRFVQIYENALPPLLPEPLGGEVAQHGGEGRHIIYFGEDVGKGAAGRLLKGEEHDAVGFGHDVVEHLALLLRGEAGVVKAGAVLLLEIGERHKREGAAHEELRALAAGIVEQINSAHGLAQVGRERGLRPQAVGTETEVGRFPGVVAGKTEARGREAYVKTAFRRSGGSGHDEGYK